MSNNNQRITDVEQTTNNPEDENCGSERTFQCLRYIEIKTKLITIIAFSLLVIFMFIYQKKILLPSGRGW